VLLPLDSGVVLLGGGTCALRYRAGAWEDLGTLPDKREHDSAARLPDGSWLVGAGEVGGRSGTTTVRVAPDGAISAGPELPGPSYDRGPLLARSDGAVLVVDEGSLRVLGGAEIAAPELRRPGCHVQTGDILWTLRWDDDAVVRTDLFGGCAVAGRGRLPHLHSAAHLLADGRVLLLGGTAYANQDCEPELFDPVAVALAALPGHDASVDRQARGLAKWRAKNG
jgi:hypothetical protein